MCSIDSCCGIHGIDLVVAGVDKREGMLNLIEVKSHFVNLQSQRCDYHLLVIIGQTV